MLLEDFIEAVESGNMNVAIVVEVTNPESEFGGVIVQMPSQAPILVEFNTSGGGDAPTPPPAPVQSVFGRVGDVISQAGDYTLDEIYPPVANFTLAGKLRIKADGSFQLWNPDQSKWHTLQIAGTAGAEYIAISAGET